MILLTFCHHSFINRIHPTVAWKDVSVRNIIPEPLADICERPSSSPSTDPARAHQSIIPTLAPQSNVPTMAPRTSTLSTKPSSTPTYAWSEEPSIVPSQVPSQYPTRFSMVEISQNPSVVASPLPTEISSLEPPSASPSIKLSLISTTQVFFPGIDEQMTESELDLFEETTTVWLQEAPVDASLVIVSVEVRGQELVFSTLSGGPTRNLRRSLDVEGTTALAVKISVAAEASVEEGDEPPSLSAFIDDVTSRESHALRDELSQVVSLFAIKEPPLDGRGGKGDGDSKDQEKNVGAIVGSVLVSMLFAITVVAAVFYRRARCTKVPLAQVQEFSCSSSSVGSTSLHVFASGENHETKDPMTMGTNMDADSHRIYPVQQLAPQRPANLFSDDDESVGSTSEFSELYAMSSVGLSTDAGDFGADLKGSSATTNQDLVGDLISPSSIAHHLYPIISVSESGESANDAPGGEGMGDSNSSLNKDNSLACRMQHQKKSMEMLLSDSDTKDDNDDSENNDNDDDGDSFGTGDNSEGAENGTEDADASTAAKKGSPIKTMFSCFQPEPPADGIQPSTLASSSILSVGSASSKSLAPHSSTEHYEIRAPPGSLGMVVVTSREGPRVYHVKDESPLANVIEEGDIIEGIDNHNTSRMTATSLRRFLRSRDAQAERVIKIRGRKRNADVESSSGDIRFEK